MDSEVNSRVKQAPATMVYREANVQQVFFALLLSPVTDRTFGQGLRKEKKVALYALEGRYRSYSLNNRHVFTSYEYQIWLQ